MPIQAHSITTPDVRASGYFLPTTLHCGVTDSYGFDHGTLLYPTKYNHAAPYTYVTCIQFRNMLNFSIYVPAFQTPEKSFRITPAIRSRRWRFGEFSTCCAEKTVKSCLRSQPRYEQAAPPQPKSLLPE